MCRDVVFSPKTSAYFRRRSTTVIFCRAVISLPTFSAMLAPPLMSLGLPLTAGYMRAARAGLLKAAFLGFWVIAVGLGRDDALQAEEPSGEDRCDPAAPLLRGQGTGILGRMGHRRPPGRMRPQRPSLRDGLAVWLDVVLCLCLHTRREVGMSARQPTGFVMVIQLAPGDCCRQVIPLDSTLTEARILRSVGLSTKILVDQIPRTQRRRAKGGLA